MTCFHVALLTDEGRDTLSKLFIVPFGNTNAIMMEHVSTISFKSKYLVVLFFYVVTAQVADRRLLSLFYWPAFFQTQLLVLGGSVKI